MSNLDSSDHRSLSTLKQSILNEPWPTRHDGASGPCSHMASFLHDRALVGICRWHSGLCLPTVVSGVFLGPFSNVNDRIMSMSDAVSSEGLKTTSIQQRSSASSLTHRDFSSFSESFDDVMLCRWWDLQSLCNLTLRNVVFKIFQCVCVCVCVCHARSDTSALEIRSRGRSGFNSLPVRSPDFEKRWAIPLSACWSRFVY